MKLTLAERLPCKQEDAGSIPVTGSGSRLPLSVWLKLVERLHGKQEAVGSIPTTDSGIT